MNGNNFYYSQNSDILDFMRGENKPCKFSPIGHGICIKKDLNTDAAIGFIVDGYMLRKRDGKLRSIPGFEDVELPSSRLNIKAPKTPIQMRENIFRI